MAMACLDAIFAKQESLKDAKNDQVLILDHLRALETLEVTLNLLQSTRIAREVGRLRRHSNECIRREASKLVSKWKKIAADSTDSTDSPAYGSKIPKRELSREVCPSSDGSKVPKHALGGIVARPNRKSVIDCGPLRSRLVTKDKIDAFFRTNTEKCRARNGVKESEWDDGSQDGGDLTLGATPVTRKA